MTRQTRRHDTSAGPSHAAQAPGALARRTDAFDYILERWAAARREPDADPDVAAALDRWSGHSFTIRSGDGPYLLEGFQTFFLALRDVVGAMDPSLPPGLPPHLLDPKTMAKFFGIPLAEFNIQATHAKSGCLEDRLDCLEAAVVQASNSARRCTTTVPFATPHPATADSAAGASSDDGATAGGAEDYLPAEVTLAEAAAILGCDKKTVLKYKAAGLLEWRNIAPPASGRPVYRLKAASVLQHRNAYQTSGPPKAPPAPTRVRVSPAAGKYRPTHITVRRD